MNRLTPQWHKYDLLGYYMGPWSSSTSSSSTRPYIIEFSDKFENWPCRPIRSQYIDNLAFWLVGFRDALLPLCIIGFWRRTLDVKLYINEFLDKFKKWSCRPIRSRDIRPSTQLQVFWLVGFRDALVPLFTIGFWRDLVWYEALYQWVRELAISVNKKPRYKTI